jgi:hypothetical protein
MATLERLFVGHHVPSLREVDLWTGSIQFGLLRAGFLWLFYVALEPYIRRRWPQSIISWSRLLGGGLRDPLVGTHMLYGVALGIGLALLFAAEELLSQPRSHYLDALLDTRHMTGSLLSPLVGETMEGMMMLLVFFFLRVLLRRQWIAVASFMLLVSSSFFSLQGNTDDVWIQAGFTVLRSGLFLSNFLLFGGLVPAIMCGFVGIFLFRLPMTTNLADWYSGSTIFAIGVVLAVTAYSFHTAVAGRPLFKAGFLERD